MHQVCFKLIYEDTVSKYSFIVPPWNGFVPPISFNFWYTFFCLFDQTQTVSLYIYQYHPLYYNSLILLRYFIILLHFHLVVLSSYSFAFLILPSKILENDHSRMMTALAPPIEVSLLLMLKLVS